MQRATAYLLVPLRAAGLLTACGHTKLKRITAANSSQFGHKWGFTHDQRHSKQPDLLETHSGVPMTERIFASVLKKRMRGHRPRLQTGKLIAIVAVMVSVAGTAAAQERQWTETNAGLPRMAARIGAIVVDPI